MAFINEYVPKIEEERSEFFRAVRTKLGLGYVVDDQWTIDRDGEKALIQTGSGHDIDTKDEEYWSFIQGGQQYRFRTTLLTSRRISSEHLYIERSIRFLVGMGLAAPDEAVRRLIKEALSVYIDFGTLSRYKSCELVLTTDDGEVVGQ